MEPQLTLSSPMPNRSILLVEDDLNVRKLFERLLTNAGFDVFEVVDGFEALHQVDARLPDAIVLDLSLPRLTGHGVLYDLHANPRTREIPVIVVTGSQDTVESPNVVCVLRKPFPSETLVRTIRECLGRGAAPSINEFEGQ